MTREEVRELFFNHPERIGHMIGFKDLGELHRDWMRKILYGDKDYTLQAHRLSYKSSCLSVAIAIWMVTHHGQNALFVRKTDSDVAESIAQAAKVLEDEKFRYMASVLLGEPVFLSKKSVNELSLNIYDSPRGASQLVGMGIGGSMTGKHADFVVCDDAINLDDRISKAERERTKSAVMELRNIVTREGRTIFIGTPWHKDDAFSLVRAPERYDCYATGLISPSKIEELKQSMSASLFAANYALTHIASENALFSEQPKWTDNAELLRDGIAHIDAAYGGEDFTAFTCARRDGDTIYIYGRLWQRHVDTVLDAILADCSRLMCAPVYCENNGDKGYLGREIQRRGYSTRVYRENMNKYQKISSYLRKWWCNIVFLEGTDAEYIAQIMDYTEDAAHDDAPDGAACCCRVLDSKQTDRWYI